MRSNHNIVTTCFCLFSAAGLLVHEIESFEISRSNGGSTRHYSHRHAGAAAGGGTSIYNSPLKFLGCAPSLQSNHSTKFQLRRDHVGGYSSTSLHLNRSNNSRPTSTSVNEENKDTIEEGNGIRNNDLNKFRSLMGTFYGIAGLAHAGDCFLGSSQLLVASGFLPFHDLSPVGQAVATIWCFAGPLAFVLSRQGGTIADLGIIVYGVVELGGAAFSPSASTIVNAGLVQGIVLASWIYSRQRGSDGSK
jgi:hypothetical protein